MCPGQKLTLGLQRDFKVGRGSDASSVDGDIAESRKKLLDSVGSEACVGPELRFTRVFLSQFKSTTLSTAEQCAELRRSLSLPDTDVILPECTEEKEEDEPGSSTSTIRPSRPPSRSKANTDLAIGVGTGLGGTAVLLVVVLLIHKRRKNNSALRAIIGKGYHASNRAPAQLPLHAQTSGATHVLHQLIQYKRRKPHHSVFLTHDNPLAHGRGVAEGVWQPDSEPSLNRVNELLRGASNGPPTLAETRGENAAPGGGLCPTTPGALRSAGPDAEAGGDPSQMSPATRAPPSSYTKYTNPFYSDTPSTEHAHGWQHL